jgi:hypothetical protein
MKLLLSAYACARNHESEHAVDWTFTTQVHRFGHEIWALVSPARHDSALTQGAQSIRRVATDPWGNSSMTRLIHSLLLVPYLDLILDPDEMVR